MNVILSIFRNEKEKVKSTLCVLLNKGQIEELFTKHNLSSDMYLHDLDCNVEKIKKFKINLVIVKGPNEIKALLNETKNEILMSEISILFEINKEKRVVNLFFSLNYAKSMFKSEFFRRKGYSYGLTNSDAKEENCILHVLHEELKEKTPVKHLKNAFKAVTNSYLLNFFKKDMQNQMLVTA